MDSGARESLKRELDFLTQTVGEIENKAEAEGYLPEIENEIHDIEQGIWDIEAKLDLYE